MSRLLEAYLASHVLILVSSAVAGRLGGRPRQRLRLARLLLLSCVLAPVAMSFVEPATRLAAVGSSARDGGGGGAQATELVAKTAPAAVAAFAAEISLPRLSELWLWGLVGLAALTHLVRLGRDLRRIRRLLAASLPLRSSCHLRLWVSEECRVPFSIRGLWYAHIVVPTFILWTPRALRIAVAHEGEHVRRGDCALAYFTELLRGVFYGNPGVHRWCRLLSEYQEYACDEALVGRRLFSPHDYGRCLYEVAQAASPSSESPRRALAAASFSVGMARVATADPSTMSLLRGRIMKLSSYQSVTPGSPWLRLATCILAVGTPLGVAYGMRGALTGAAPVSLAIRPNISLVPAK